MTLAARTRGAVARRAALLALLLGAAVGVAVIYALALLALAYL